MRLSGEKMLVDFCLGKSDTITLGTSLIPIPIYGTNFSRGRSAISYTEDGVITFKKAMNVFLEVEVYFRSTASTNRYRELRLYKNGNYFASYCTYLPGGYTWMSAHVGPAFNHFDEGDELTVGISSCISGDVLSAQNTYQHFVIMEV